MALPLLARLRRWFPFLRPGREQGRADQRDDSGPLRHAEVVVGGPTAWIGEAAQARSRTSEMRARRLLRRMLSEQQQRELQTHDCFTVEVRGRGRFCILPRSTFNVFHIQTGNLYCCNTEAFLPLSDLMLAQKLLLESDPDRFFAVANCKPEIFAGPLEQQMRRMLSREQREQRDVWVG
jgi:hypothetical protein